MQAFKAESSGLRQRLAAQQREVGSLKHSLADHNLAKCQSSQVNCLLQYQVAGQTVRNVIVSAICPY